MMISKKSKIDVDANNGYLFLSQFFASLFFWPRKLNR